MNQVKIQYDSIMISLDKNSIRLSRSKKIWLASIVFIFAFYCVPLYAEKPLIAVVGVKTKSPRLLGMAGLLETHLVNISGSTGIFDQVNSSLIRQELRKYGCTDESCMLRFAETAGINVFISGSIEDQGSKLLVRLRTSGIDAPYYGKNIVKQDFQLPKSVTRLSLREISYICEETAGRFISQYLKEYQHRVLFKHTDEKGMFLDAPLSVSGKFTFYHSKKNKGKIWLYKKAGTVEITDNKIKGSGPEIREGDFIFCNYTNKAVFLEKFYRGRKKELVFESPTISSALYTVFFSVPGSVMMPVMAPVGYYTYGDFAGLGLWAVNMAPYFYIEYDGIMNRPQEQRKDNRNISRREFARYYFSLYMVFIGGLPLFVDAFSHYYLSRASMYQKVHPLMGNEITAVYLSLISNGGGHFYKGNRLWGYLYFHLNNILVYNIIKEFSPEDKYNSGSGTYDRNHTDKKRGYYFIGALCFTKLVEIIHVLISENNIKAARKENGFSKVLPELSLDRDYGTYMGVRFACRL